MPWSERSPNWVSGVLSQPQHRCASRECLVANSPRAGRRCVLHNTIASAAVSAWYTDRARRQQQSLASGPQESELLQRGRHRTMIDYRLVRVTPARTALWPTPSADLPAPQPPLRPDECSGSRGTTASADTGSAVNSARAVPRQADLARRAIPPASGMVKHGVPASPLCPSRCGPPRSAAVPTCGAGPG